MSTYCEIKKSWSIISKKLLYAYLKYLIVVNYLRQQSVVRLELRKNVYAPIRSTKSLFLYVKCTYIYLFHILMQG